VQISPIAGYHYRKGVEGNEAADKKAREITEQIGPLPKPETLYLSAVPSLLREPFREAWERRWKDSPKGHHLYSFTPSPSLANRREDGEAVS